jgi:Domain of unknown function (DUF4149)
MFATFIAELKTTLLSAWLGAALLFSAVVAPAVFGVLRQFNLANAGEIAGAIVTRTLTAVNLSGFLIAVVALVTTLLWKRSAGRLASILQLLSLAVLATTTAVGHWIVATRMLALRATLAVPIDRLGLDDPRRQSFNKMHGYSVALLGTAMLATLIAIVAGRIKERGAGR